MRYYFFITILLILVFTILGEAYYEHPIQSAPFAIVVSAQGDPPPLCAMPPCVDGGGGGITQDERMRKIREMHELISYSTDRADNRIKRIAKVIIPKYSPDLEELQEFEALKRIGKRRELTIKEQERLNILEQGGKGVSIDDKALSSYEFLYRVWKAEGSEKSLLKLMDVVTLVGLRNGINSAVSISSATTGATIKYQTLYERNNSLEPTTAKQVTTCKETMPIGYYYIWSERNGKVTSDITAKFYIVSDEEVITLAEK